MPHLLLSDEFRQTLGEMVDATVRDALARDVRDGGLGRAVQEAVDEELGLPARAAIDEAARAILEAIADVHAQELAASALELPDLLEVKLDGALSEESHLALSAVDDTLRADEAVNAAALRLLEKDLRRALASPQLAERKRTVMAVVEAERERLFRRDQRRVARAFARVWGARLLPDEAFE